MTMKSADKDRQLAAKMTARLYLDRLTERDHDELQQWLEQDAANQKAYQTTLDTWHSLGALADSAGELLPSRSKTRLRRFHYWWMAAAPALAASLLLVVWYDQPVQTPPKSSPIVRYDTQVGEQRLVQLQDGSRVVLNTNTRLLVDITGLQRRVLLEQGEAFFEISPNAERPFIVNTGTNAVTVLGTRFNVHKSGLTLDVVVYDGSVAVHRAEDLVTAAATTVELSPDGEPPVADQYRLNAGVRASFRGSLGSANTHIAVAKLNRNNQGGSPSWQRGEVQFNNQSLHEVVKELNRYLDKKILIEDSRIMDTKISGVFNVKELGPVFSRLENVFGLSVTQYSDRIVIVARD